MTRQQAQQNKKKDFGLSSALLSLTDSVASEILQTMKESDNNEVGEEVLHQLYLDYNFEKPNEENFETFKDIIFDALQACFTPQELHILKKSNEDSGNYHLMYRTLKDYFLTKLEHQGKTKPSMLTKIDDDETYAIIFKQMAEITEGFAPKNPTSKKFLDVEDRKREPDYNKINEIFET